MVDAVRRLLMMSENGPELDGSHLVLDGGDLSLTDPFIHKMSPHWCSKTKIIVTRVDEPGPHAVAMAIAAACSGRLLVSPDRRDGLRFARIVPIAEVAAPKPLPHPEHPADVPAAIKVGSPPSVENDYREHPHSFVVGRQVFAACLGHSRRRFQVEREREDHVAPGRRKEST